MRLIPKLGLITLRSVVPVLLFCSVTGALSGQSSPTWHDPSPHKIQFVTVDVDQDVKLEVLDWGGSGRPLVLLAGLGNTAHVFDDFALKLTPQYHVYGITRRGFGASSAPVPDKNNYSADRLGDDVLAVLDALKIDRPALVGHSVAGSELSSIGSRYPGKVAGLIYLDAAYSFAYYDHAQGDLNLDSHELERKLDALQPDKWPPDVKTARDLLVDLQQVEKDLQDSLKPQPPSPPPLAPTDADLQSIAALSLWRKTSLGVTFPEAELRQMYLTTPEGQVGERRAKPSTPLAIIAGQQKYTNLRIPILAIYAIPRDMGLYAADNPALHAALEEAETASNNEQARAFQAGVPSARIVRLPYANHYVFISNEADVLREMRQFLAGLP